jgi:U32 family peptidase
MSNRTELLAPAGSFESLQAALQAGADAIYFGVEQLNMRARATGGFSTDDLGEIRKRCTANGARAYLTLNTILYDHDLPLMRRIMDAAKAAGIDAVIACDQAALNYARRIGLPVHISTQANVSNVEAVEFYSPYADMIVLARELSLRQVAEVIRQVKRREIRGVSGNPMKIEVFAHGALCMAISGKCYLSLHSDFASANRGACVQNCRRSYLVKDAEGDNEYEVDGKYIMSAQDLCTIDFLDKLLATGADVLKIEGRGRSADYVYTTTKCYREAIDAVHNGTYTAEKAASWKKELATVFNRGFWGGYYLGKKTGEWADEYGSKARKKKIYLGKGMKYFEREKVAEFRMESDQLSESNEILITGPTTGVVSATIGEMRVDGRRVTTVKKGALFSIPLEVKIRPSDKLYRLADAHDQDYTAAQ